MLTLACLTQCAVFATLVRHLDRQTIEPIERSRFKDNFPVLVILPAPNGPGHVAHLVYAPDVAAFVGQHPEHSFLVPEAEEASLREQLRKGQKASGARGERMSPPFSFDFRVLKREPGRQELEVDGSDDDWRMKSWYVATEKSYEPQKLQAFFGPGMGLLALPASVVLNGAVWLALWLAWFTTREVRRWRSG